MTISFRTAEGLEAGKTKIRYKDVEVGLITHVALARDDSGVIAEAQFAKEASNLLVEDTRFWVVQAARFVEQRHRTRHVVLGFVSRRRRRQVE